ncbi:MAG: hypothetical protein ABIZ81_01595 [Opitutaceae bacterium]
MKHFCLSLALTGAFAGCNSTYVKVDAVARAEAEKSIAYQIGTSNPQLEVDSLRYKEAERYVKTALSGKGLYEAPNAEMADMVVNLDYGVSPPRVTREVRSEPIFREEPGATSTEQVQVGTDAKGNPIYGTITVRGPSTMKYVGDRQYVVMVVTYEKYLRLSAREAKSAGEGRPPAEIWTVDVSTSGENRDLRKALPALAAATIEYVGKDTRGEKTIKLKDGDKNGPIAFVKKGL